tara:strand:- start:609 stop:716 length:108 start_codon:yes stop_codon:yes gene_type:complete
MEKTTPIAEAFKTTPIVEEDNKTDESPSKMIEESD